MELETHIVAVPSAQSRIISTKAKSFQIRAAFTARRKCRRCPYCRALQRCSMTLQADTLDLIAVLRVGDNQAVDQAATILFDRYMGRLIALSRKLMSGQLARKVGPEDVAQSAYKSFLLRARAGEFTLGESNDVWKLLAAMVLNKIRQHVHKFSTGKRQLAREVDYADARVLCSREPSPEEAAMLADEVKRLLQELPERHRRVAVLFLQGYSAAEISSETHYSPERVRQITRDIRRQQERRFHAS